MIQFTALEAQAGGGLFGMMLPLILMMALVYFLMVRPQKKREQKLRDQINAVKVGDEIVTIGGIRGRIFNIQNDEVTISSSVQNTLITFKKSAISAIISKTAETANKTTTATSKESPAEDGEKKPGLLGKIMGKTEDKE